MSDEFDLNNDDILKDDDIFGDSASDSTSGETKKQESTSEHNARMKEREESRAKMGWKIPVYQELLDEIDESEPLLPKLTEDFKKLKSEGKDNSSEAMSIKNQVKRIRTIQNQIETIEENVDLIMKDACNFNNIIDYGSDVLQSLGEKAEENIKLQKASYHEFNVFNGTLEQVKTVMETGDVADIMELIKNTALELSKKTGQTGKKVGKTGAGIAKKTWKGLFGGKAAKEQKQTDKDIEMENALLDALPEKYKEIKDAAVTIENIEQNLLEHATRVADIGKENLQAVSKLTIYLSAADEILRIYDEELIPELIKIHNKEGSQSSEQELAAFETARTDFFDQTIDLEATMFRARGNVLKNNMNLKNSKEQIKTVRKRRKNYVNQCMVTLEETISQGTTVMRNRALLKHDGIDADLDGLSINLQEAGAASRKALADSGLKKIERLIEGNTRLTKLLANEATEEVNYNQKQLQAREDLAKVTDDLASEEIKRTKLLADNRTENRKALSGPSTKTEDTKKPDNSSISNDNSSTVSYVRPKRNKPKTPGQ